ncbi:MAG: acyl-CoA dehydrogenase family protein [Rhodocyclaceae bacterium]|nr:acyl-CoA dehydrogenase family protein [Rhodocyclaceae bacterium]MCA3075229.1 acyl-CoA dehydrogenase family protein [Rhodocyclaceae bacterium]MCA3088381.1 acyl-CoA dehydrogenase family protein [Rhodocyclaceae bacterium]MCA3094281.1 acyl-CoA dehydrogenase family protein [Rhodocyclaceae bacterium]MCA3096625.1 acyl-CoA dehydrogenase family protein [Rhodocyclaceae bacterium]
MIQDAETLGLLLDSIRRFVRERLIPAEVEVTEADAMPEAIVHEMREMGLFGYALPREYGGLGLTTEEQMHVSFELCYASPVFRSYVGTNNGIGGMGIVIDGTPAQKERYLRRLAAGEIIGSFALTEPDNGSDAGGLKTFARRDGDHYVINGTKRYITNAPEASIFTLMARTDASQKGAAGVSAFIVERDTPGLTTAPPDRKMGQRGSHTSDVILQDVRVPASALIGGVEGQGFKTAMKVLDRARLNIAAVCVGIAQRMLDETLAYAMQREQFGQPIAGFQLVQAMLADSKTEIYAARCMTLDAARRADDGANIATEASCAKLFASEMCSRVADRCVQVHGGAGYMQEYPIERLYRDVRLFRIFEGTSQIQQLVIAKNMIRDARG